MDKLIATLAVNSLALTQNLYSIYKKNDTPKRRWGIKKIKKLRQILIKLIERKSNLRLVLSTNTFTTHPSGWKSLNFDEFSNCLYEWLCSNQLRPTYRHGEIQYPSLIWIQPWKNLHSYSSCKRHFQQRRWF